MNIHIDATGGLVSNPREKETRGSRGRTAAPLHLEVGTSSLGDRHIAKRDKGQLSNRKLMDPSIGKLTQFDDVTGLKKNNQLMCVFNAKDMP